MHPPRRADPSARRTGREGNADPAGRSAANFLGRDPALSFLSRTMHTPVDVQIIGQEVAIRWSDGAESFFPAERLRAASPSAETQGERDIFGRQYGGHGPRTFDGVTVRAWDRVGNYALRFVFSDGHQTGLYTYDYLRALADRLDAGS